MLSHLHLDAPLTCQGLSLSEYLIRGLASVRGRSLPRGIFHAHCASHCVVIGYFRVAMRRGQYTCMDCEFSCRKKLPFSMRVPDAEIGCMNRRTLRKRANQEHRFCYFFFTTLRSLPNRRPIIRLARKSPYCIKADGTASTPVPASCCSSVQW